MWTALCSLTAKAVAERAMLPSGKKKDTTHKKIHNLSYFIPLLPVFSHSFFLTFEGFSVEQ